MPDTNSSGDAPQGPDSVVDEGRLPQRQQGDAPGFSTSNGEPSRESQQADAGPVLNGDNPLTGDLCLDSGTLTLDGLTLVIPSASLTFQGGATLDLGVNDSAGQLTDFARMDADGQARLPE